MDRLVDGPPDELLERSRELAAVERVVGAVREGMSATLLVRGEAGIGKTALLDAAVASAPGVPVLRVVAVKSEMQLAFAGLHMLLRPHLGSLDDLPVPQRAALRAAFGLDKDGIADRFIVGLGVLSMLADVAATSGLLVIVDDAQWLDQESVDAISFVARRIYADGIGMLIALRHPSERSEDFVGVPDTTLDQLSDESATALLVATFGDRLDEHARARVVSDARGNPLALLELGRELTDAPALTAFMEPLPVSRTVRERFLRQARALPASTQRLLLAASADPSGDPDLLWRAGRELRFKPQDAAVADELINVSMAVTFRHPLIREAVYHGATLDERVAVHAALAAVTDAARSPEQRAAHLAIASLGPDDDIAAELERVADRARRSGGYAMEAAFLAKAAMLSATAPERGRRYLIAAAAEVNAARPALAAECLQRADAHLDPALSPRARRLQATIEFLAVTQGHSRTREADDAVLDPTAVMLDAAAAYRDVDVLTARKIILDAFFMAMQFGSCATTGLEDVARLATTLDLQAATSAMDLTVAAFTAIYTRGYDEGAPLLRASLELFEHDDRVRAVPRRIGFASLAALAAGDFAAARRLGREFETTTRSLGALTLLIEALHCLGLCELGDGTLDAASTLYQEACELERALGMRPAGEVSRLIVLAWQGETEDVRSRAPVLARDAKRDGWGVNVQRAQYAMTLLELSHGNYAEAAAAHRFDPINDDLPLSGFIAADLVEANTRGGEPTEAQRCLKWLEARARANATNLELGLAARARALVAASDTVERDYRTSIELLEQAGARLHCARSQLVFGEWLRRHKRRREARDQLRAATEGFDAMGAATFAERARTELRATGESARKRVDETRDALTPQEAHVARLAATGATNAEIATQLFISPKTVDYHLQKVFRKYGVSSRRALARRHNADGTAHG
ncbi:MAG: LuxR C-terminal-related transcriptional regulator [Acidimicrobiales bacterium]